MKLNKVKLTAMAMSVMMAMSSMSVATFAEENATEAATEAAVDVAEVVEEEAAGEEVALEAEAEVAPQASTTNPPVESAMFERLEVVDINRDTIKVVWDDGSITDPISQTVTVTPATCKDLEVRVYKVEIVAGEYKELKVEVPGTILTDHKWGAEYKEVVVAAGCETIGLTRGVQKCEVCGETRIVNNYEIEPEGHKVSSWSFIKYLVAGDPLDGVAADAVNTKLVNGKPALIDSTVEGFYITLYEGVCSKCGKNDTKIERTRIEAEQIISTSVKNTVNIDEEKTAAAFGKTSFADVTADMLKANTNSIVLKDCLKPGSYQVYYEYQTNSTNPRIETVTVAAHHSEIKKVVFVNSADQWKCTVNGTTVVNNTCNEDIRYYINTTCRQCNINRNSEEMIAKPQGPHKIDRDVDKYLSTHITDGILDSYEDFMNWLVDNNKTQYVRVDTTATCTENGVTTVTLLCTTCKEPTDTVYTAKTDMFNHYSVTKNAVVELKESTCSEKGYIISADKCNLCGKELSNRVKKEIKRLAHTNEIGINDNGTSKGTKTVLDATTTVELAGDVLIDINGETLAKNGTYILPADLVKSTTGTLAVRVYNNCSVCSKNKQNITAAQTVSIKITGIQKETQAKAGSISLDVQVEGVDAKGSKKVISKQFTAPYYSNMAAYLDRKDSTVKLNGLQLVDGKFYYYKDDVVDTSFKGLVEYNGKLFYVENGTVATGVNGAKLIADTWYFLAYGMVQTDYVGLTTYGGKAFYVQNGIIDVNVGGLVEFDGRKFAVASGRIIDEYSGLWQDPASGTWYYLVRGQVTDKTTLVLYDGAWFYVIDGKLASDFTGTVNYDGAKFNVVKGQVYGQA